MRVFVSVAPPLEVRRAALGAAKEAVRDLGDSVRWIRPENVHLTLTFLGEVPDESLEGIRGALRAACSGYAPFDARLEGLGAFPSPRRARVIWAGMDEGAAETTALAEGVEAALESLGFERERRPYVPHATLGRAKGRSVSIALPEKGVSGAQIFRVGSAELTKSTLTRAGSIYETVESFPLGGAEGNYSR